MSWARGHAACSSKLRSPSVGSATKAAALSAEASRRAARASATKASNEARASRSTDGVSISLRAVGAGPWPASPCTAVVALSAVASARRHAALSSEAVAQRLARMSAVRAACKLATCASRARSLAPIAAASAALR